MATVRFNLRGDTPTAFNYGPLSWTTTASSSITYDSRFLVSLLASGFVGCANLQSSAMKPDWYSDLHVVHSPGSAIELGGGGIKYEFLAVKKLKGMNEDAEIDLFARKIVYSQVDVSDELVVMLSKGMVDFYD